MRCFFTPATSSAPAAFQAGMPCPLPGAHAARRAAVRSACNPSQPPCCNGRQGWLRLAGPRLTCRAGSAACCTACASGGRSAPGWPGAPRRPGWQRPRACAHRRGQAPLNHPPSQCPGRSVGTPSAVACTAANEPGHQPVHAPVCQEPKAPAAGHSSCREQRPSGLGPRPRPPPFYAATTTHPDTHRHGQPSAALTHLLSAWLLLAPSTPRSWNTPSRLASPASGRGGPLGATADVEAPTSISGGCSAARCRSHQCSTSTAAAGLQLGWGHTARYGSAGGQGPACAGTACKCSWQAPFKGEAESRALRTVPSDPAFPPPLPHPTPPPGWP